MLGKLALLFKGKVAAAVLGSALLVGGGTTAVLAANNGQLPFVGQTQLQEHQDNDDNNNGANENHNDGQQVEGVIKSIDTGNSRFTLTPQQGAVVTVVVNAQTVFEGGLSNLGSLKVGQHVEAKGTLQSDGSLLAAKVEGQNANNDQNENELKGTIASVNTGNNSFVLKLSNGTTRTVTVSSKTVFDGGFQSFADLKAGASVEVHGNLQSDGTLAATRVHREDDDNDANDDHGGASGSGADDGANHDAGDDHGGNSGNSGSGGSGSGNSGSGSGRGGSH